MSIIGSLGSYRLLAGDLRSFFEYVHPSEENLNTYSHRAFSLLLRACTEFENLCKLGAKRVQLELKDRPNIGDYSALKDSLHLREIKVLFNEWPDGPLLLDPLHGWEEKIHRLEWYRSYNNVKHDRDGSFANANLNNIIFATSACFAMLVGLRDLEMPLENHVHSDLDHLDFHFTDSLFSIRIRSESYARHFTQAPQDG